MCASIGRLIEIIESLKWESIYLHTTSDWKLIGPHFLQMKQLPTLPNKGKKKEKKEQDGNVLELLLHILLIVWEQ